MMDEARLQALCTEQIHSFEDAEPVFVIGGVRSGTSIMMQALRDGGQLRGFNEGNVASLMQRVIDCAETHLDNAGALAERRRAAGVDTDDIRSFASNYIGALYAKFMGAGPWMDKSPESYEKAPMVRFSPTLLKIFPNARFVFCMRRGIENVRSRQRKFPNIPFLWLCKSWADCTRTWLETAPLLGDRGIEIRQDAIALEPEETARRLAAFLGLDDERRVAMGRIFAHDRPEQSQFAQEHRFLGLDETGWSAEEQELFRSICGEWMEKAGFSLEPEVLRAAPPIHLFYPITPDAIQLENLAPEAFRPCGAYGLELDAQAAHAGESGVRYPGVPLAGQCRFEGEVRLDPSATGSVELGLSIRKAGMPEVVVQLRRTLQPGGCEQWSESFESLEGLHDVTIEARRGDAGEGGVATTRWVDARLLT